jgi:hypothetical protein
MQLSDLLYTRLMPQQEENEADAQADKAKRKTGLGLRFGKA